MKIRHFILSGLAVAAMGFVAVGCNENPTTPDDNGSGLSAPTNLQATSLSSTSVGLKWTATTDTAVTYTVSWAATDGTDSNSAAGITTTSYTASNLNAKSYNFYVREARSTSMSSAATLVWAPAARYGTTTTIRMYQKQSSQGSGLVLDPALGGPLNVSVATPPNKNSVQLAIYTKSATSDTFSIGPAYAFVEYRNADAFDQNSYISSASYPAQSLDEWYSTGSIDTKIPTDGNTRAFDFPAAQTGGFGQGFYVRTGTNGNYHYARVFVKNVGGKLLQGSGNDRFVEVEISYQQTANLPYAKPVHGETAPNVYSTLGH